jgi:AcrR family transcriptional regulator
MAKVTRPTLYHYFKNKKGLYSELLDSAIVAFTAALDPTPDEPEDLRMRLQSIFIRAKSFLRTHPDELNMINTHLLGPPSGIPPYHLPECEQFVEIALANLLLPSSVEGKIEKESFNAVLLLVSSLLRNLLHPSRDGRSFCGWNMAHYFKALDLIVKG